MGRAVAAATAHLKALRRALEERIAEQANAKAELDAAIEAEDTARTTFSETMNEARAKFPGEFLDVPREDPITDQLNAGRRELQRAEQAVAPKREQLMRADREVELAKSAVINAELALRKAEEAEVAVTEYYDRVGKRFDRVFELVAQLEAECSAIHSDWEASGLGVHLLAHVPIVNHVKQHDASVLSGAVTIANQFCWGAGKALRACEFLSILETVRGWARGAAPTAEVQRRWDAISASADSASVLAAQREPMPEQLKPPTLLQRLGLAAKEPAA